ATPQLIEVSACDRSRLPGDARHLFCFRRRVQRSSPTSRGGFVDRTVGGAVRHRDHGGQVAGGAAGGGQAGARDGVREQGPGAGIRAVASPRGPAKVASTRRMDGGAAAVYRAAATGGCDEAARRSEREVSSAAVDEVPDAERLRKS